MRKIFKYFIAGIAAFSLGLSVNYNKQRNEFNHSEPQATASTAKELGYTLPLEYVESIEGIAHYHNGMAQIGRDGDGKVHKIVPILPPDIGSLERALIGVDTNKNHRIERDEITTWYNTNFPRIDEKNNSSNYL